MKTNTYIIGGICILCSFLAGAYTSKPTFPTSHKINPEIHISRLIFGSSFDYWKLENYELFHNPIDSSFRILLDEYLFFSDDPVVLNCLMENSLIIYELCQDEGIRNQISDSTYGLFYDDNVFYRIKDKFNMIYEKGKQEFERSSNLRN